MPGYANPQNLNRYSYVNNSPLMYTDPTGHKFCENRDNNGDCKSDEEMSDLWDTTHKEPEEDGGGPEPEKEPSNGTCGEGGVVNCPPSIYYGSYLPLRNGYSLTLHPSDYLFGSSIMGMLPLYAKDGTLLGYYRIDAAPLKTRFNINADGKISGVKGLIITTTMSVANSITKSWQAPLFVLHALLLSVLCQVWTS